MWNQSSRALEVDSAHGQRGGGDLHALVDGATPGFMRAPDYTRLSQMGVIPLTFGMAGLAIVNTTRFLGPGFASPSTAEIQMPLARAGELRNLRLRATAGPGGAQTGTLRIRIDGVDTALTVTLTGAEVAGANTSDIVVVGAGALLSVSLTSSLLSVLANLVATVEYLN